MKWKHKSNYNQSVRKWQKAIEMLENKEDVCSDVRNFVMDLCGFCAESVGMPFKDVTASPNCEVCPLYPTHCNMYKFDKHGGLATFWQIDEALKNNDRTTALIESKNLLVAIKSYAP